jgi:hypothetical protein
MRTSFIEHEGRKIVFMDFSNCKTIDEALAAIEEARQFVAKQPKVQNLLTLVDTQNSRFDSRVIDALKKLAAHDRPWVLAGAVVGMSAVQRTVYRLVNTITRRNLSAFDTLDEAKAWLVGQRAPEAAARP